MAYMKTGAVREVRTRTKVTVAVVLAVLLLVLACVIFAVKNPRAAFRKKGRCIAPTSRG